MRVARAFPLLFALALPSCAVGKQLIAGDDDLADYRAFRVAAHEGTRLSLGQRYLRAHPRGAWADEVSGAFDAEEPPYFETAKQSANGAYTYLLDLPRGPHADAARAVIDAAEDIVKKAALAALIAEARHTRMSLKSARAQRRKVRERVLGEVKLLLDPRDYGVAPGLVAAPLLEELSFGARPTIGWVVPHREDTLFFEVPTPQGRDVAGSTGGSSTARDARVVTVDFDLVVANGVVVEGRVRGEDLFVRWAEADLARVFDPTDPTAREEAFAHVTGMLIGAVEALLPSDRCSPSAQPRGQLLARACDGWQMRATSGAHAGAIDEIVVRHTAR